MMVQLDKQWKEGKRVLVSQIQDKARELSGDKDFATRGWWGKFKKSTPEELTPPAEPPVTPPAELPAPPQPASRSEGGH